MDLKKFVDKVKDTAEDLKEQAEAKFKETRDALDKDKDGIPDAVKDLTDKAKILAAQAQEKAKDLKEQAEAKLEKVKSNAEKAVDSARARMGDSDKDIKKG